MRGRLHRLIGRVDVRSFLPSVHEVRLGRNLERVMQVARPPPAER